MVDMTLASLVQVDEESATSETVTFLMNEIANRRHFEGTEEKITSRKQEAAYARD